MTLKFTLDPKVLLPSQVEMYKNAIKKKMRLRALMMGVEQEAMTLEEKVIYELARDVGYFPEEIPAEIVILGDSE